MKKMSLVDAQEQLASLVDTLEEGPVLLLRKGWPCAALVGLGERFDMEASLGKNKRLRRLVDEACRRTSETGGIPFSQILAEVEHAKTRRKTRAARAPARNS